MLDIYTSYPSTQLDYNKSLGLDSHVPLGNIGFCNIGPNRRLVAIRQFNYKIHGHLQWMGGFLDNRAYHFIVTDSDFNFIKRVECAYFNLWALEDIRLMDIGKNIIQASATDVSYGDGKYRMCSCRFKMCDIDSDGPSRLEIVDIHTFPWRYEKNYIPVEGDAGAFITDIERNKFKMATIYRSSKQNQYCGGLFPIRGSTPLMKYRTGYVAIVHRKVPRENRYINRFMFCNDKMSLCRFSKEFTVGCSISPINFLCGMSIEDDYAVVPFCVNDRLTYLFRLPIRDFRP